MRLPFAFHSQKQFRTPSNNRPHWVIIFYMFYTESVVKVRLHLFSQEALKKFRKNCEEIRQYSDSSKKLIDNTIHRLKNARVLENLQQALSNSKEQKQLQSLCSGDAKRLRPCLVFIGQTNAGKSTLINELLGKTRKL